MSMSMSILNNNKINNWHIGFIDSCEFKWAYEFKILDNKFSISIITNMMNVSVT